MSTPASGGFFNTAWLFKLRLAVRRLWLRAALFGVLGVATAVLAAFLAPYVPSDIAVKIGGRAVDTILSLMASSMLAVTTFSLSTMVAAQAAAAQSGSPRATELLTEDNHAHNALSTFIGAFLFSVVGLVALETESYGAHGRVIMFGVTILVLVAVVATLIRWVDSLARLGRVSNTISKLEKVTRDAIEMRGAQPFRGGKAYKALPRGTTAIAAPSVGYVQYIDMAALGRLADKHEITLYLEADTGSFMYPGRPLARYRGTLDEDGENSIAASFVLGDRRTFEQDMRYGLIVLCEVAQRALSAAVNDPGTAMDVIAVQLRLLAQWHDCRSAFDGGAEYEHIHVREPSAEELLDDAFAPVARDAAGNAEVQLRLQKAFAALEALGDDDGNFARAARRHAKIARERALKAFTHEADRKLLERAV